MIDKDTLLYGSFAKQAGSKGCKFSTAFQKLAINATINHSQLMISH